jgi:cytochrome c553
MKLGVSIVRASGAVARLSGAFLLATLAAAPALGADAPAAVVGDAKAGATKAAVCGACHGITGNSVNPEWPNLAGQHHEYIVEQLHLFKGMVRTNPIMQAQAVALSEQDMADVAAYMEQQTLTGGEADPATVEVAQKLYRGGDAKRGIPACSACHGPNGLGNGPAKWPQIRAQHSTYVYTQLKNYAAKQRYVAQAGQPAPPPQAEMMYTVASRLTDDEMKALAGYLQGLR